MKRLLISFAGGLVLPLVFFAAVNFLAVYLEIGLKGGWPTIVLAHALFWPIFLWEPIFPQPPSCQSCGPTNAALVAAVITCFVFYSALTYVIQRVISPLWLRFYDRRRW